MAKKHFQIQPKQSPENYIRQKARNLPVYKCFVNSDWKESSSAIVIVARQHVNGNITFASFEVDLYCLGIKDALYFFNLSVDDFEHILHTYSEGLVLIEVEYALAHNIVYAGYEYALELDIEPHKDFAIARYLLEVDENVELIDIECGRNGKPFLVRSESMGESEFNAYLNKLEKEVGKGNFEFIDVLDLDDWKENDFFEEEDESCSAVDDEPEYTGMYLNWPYEPGYQPVEEKYPECNSEDSGYKDNVSGPMDYSFSPGKCDDYYSEINKLPFLQKKIIYYQNYLPFVENIPGRLNLSKLMAVTDSIYTYDLCDGGIVDDYIRQWKSEVKTTVNDNPYDERFLGLAKGRKLTAAEKVELDLLDEYLFNERPILYKKKLAELRVILGDIPYLEYMDMLNPHAGKEKFSKKKLTEASIKHPDFILFKLELGFIEIGEKIKKKKTCDLPRFEDFFPEGRPVYVREMMKFQTLKILAIIYKGDLDAADSLHENLTQYGLDPMALNEYLNLIGETRINMLHNHFSAQKNIPDEVFQIKVELLGIQPRIWRRIQVADNISLEELHNILQISMGWTDSHLHAFIHNNVRFEKYDFENELWWEMDQIDYSGFKVRDLINTVGQQLKYEYDFGDGWKHLLTLEKIEYYKPGKKTPKCLEGARKCPPEDIGSVFGYRNMLKILAKPEHPEYQSYISWLGGPYNPEEFDSDQINFQLTQDHEL